MHLLCTKPDSTWIFECPLLQLYTILGTHVLSSLTVAAHIKTKICSATCNTKVTLKKMHD